MDIREIMTGNDRFQVTTEKVVNLGLNIKTKGGVRHVQVNKSDVEVLRDCIKSEPNASAYPFKGLELTLMEALAVVKAELPPAMSLLKKSRYSIKTNSLYHKEFLATAKWAEVTSDPRVIRHRTNGNEYLLAAIDKSAGYGETEFFNMDTGEYYKKYEVKQWLKTKSGSVYIFPIKFNTIVEFESIGNPTAVVTVDTGRDELPF